LLCFRFFFNTGQREGQVRQGFRGLAEWRGSVIEATPVSYHVNYTGIGKGPSCRRRRAMLSGKKSGEHEEESGGAGRVAQKGGS
jgi:hypothetical protein